MDPITGQYLLDRLLAVGHFSELQARTYVDQYIDIFSYLHNMSFIHRNLTLEAVRVVEDGSLELVDFSLARKF